jgi:hypothetical protein
MSKIKQSAPLITEKTHQMQVIWQIMDHAISCLSSKKQNLQKKKKIRRDGRTDGRPIRA